jgi:hypothetical protein
MEVAALGYGGVVDQLAVARGRSGTFQSPKRWLKQGRHISLLCAP